MSNIEYDEAFSTYRRALFPETVKRDDSMDLEEPELKQTYVGIPSIVDKQQESTNRIADKLKKSFEQKANKEKEEKVLEKEEPTVAEAVVEHPTKTKREELYELQESKRAAKIQVDQKLILLGWTLAVAIAFVSSAIVSFNGITAVAQFVGLSASWMAGLFFFFIELMYIIFLIAYLLLSSRVDENGEPEKTGGALAGMISFAAIAVGANAFHTLDFWDWNTSNPQMWAGVVLSIAAPIAIISASKMASRVVFAKAIKL